MIKKLISWDPSCVNAGNMPFPLVVRSLDRGTHLLEFAAFFIYLKISDEICQK
jgi:hypothetical protein